MQMNKTANKLDSSSNLSTMTTYTNVDVMSKNGFYSMCTASSSEPNACFRTESCMDIKHHLSTLTLDDLSFIQRLGSGDIGTVYLVELKGVKGCMFAAKVMDKEELQCRNKENRAGTEREILEMLYHPFLPSLYATLDCPRWSCLLTEFCPGGDLHVLQQCQPEKRFDESAVRFYASEVVAALEYLHMLGIIYRDLKPENVLVRSDGHIMLTDFDLSLKCDDLASKAKVVYVHAQSKEKSLDHTTNSTSFSMKCILPICVAPPRFCFHPGRKQRKKPGYHRTIKVVAEPVDARSMSFVGTYEYLAPEIVSGEGHGNAVDWWTLGIFIYELFYGITPFKGGEDEFTLTNIVACGLEFPKEPVVSPLAKDLISQLLHKDPNRRMGCMTGATAIKHHAFFEGVNWALLRCQKPPYTPQPINRWHFVPANYDNSDASVDYF